MGAWGPGLFSDDVACDVKEYYMNCLREEMSADEAEAAVVSYFGDELADSDDGPVVVLALADTAWRVGRLSEKLKEAAIRIIDTGEGLGRWEVEGKQLLKKRQDVLQKLKEKLLSPQPSEKKVYKYRLYKCEWKIGDVFAYRFESEIAKEKGYYGRYLLIQKVDEGIWHPGHVVPIVYFRITKDMTLPSIDDIKNIECLKMGLGKKEPEIIYDYRGKLINTSKRIIPKSLIYLGNVDVIYHNPEYVPEYDVSYSSFEWKCIEEEIIKLNERYSTK